MRGVVTLKSTLLEVAGFALIVWAAWRLSFTLAVFVTGLGLIAAAIAAEKPGISAQTPEIRRSEPQKSP